MTVKRIEEVSEEVIRRELTYSGDETKYRQRRRTNDVKCDINVEKHYFNNFMWTLLVISEDQTDH